MPWIEINLLRGRTKDQKRKLLEAVTRAVSDSIDAPLNSIAWIQEVDADEYMVGGRLRSDAEDAG